MIAQQPLTVTKLDAAKSHLQTAITLFFDHADPTPIHTITCAAYDIVDSVNQFRGGKTMWVKRRYTQLPGRPNRADLNEAQNFLKHGDRDPEGTLEFFPLQTEPMLVDECRTYSELTGECPRLFEIMLRWFSCHGGAEEFGNWPIEKHDLRDDLLALFAQGDRRGFRDRCDLP